MKKIRNYITKTEEFSILLFMENGTIKKVMFIYAYSMAEVPIAQDSMSVLWQIKK